MSTTMIERLPVLEQYGEYKGSNSRTLRVTFGPLSVWFSYTTPIAFQYHNNLVVRKNDWGSTTGKHLNWIDGGNHDPVSKLARMSGPAFEQALSDAMLREGNKI